MNAPLLPIDTRLFQESCDVVILEGEEGRQALAEWLAGESLALEADHALDALKAKPSYRAASDLYDLDRQQHRGGAL